MSHGGASLRDELLQDWHRYSDEPPRWKAVAFALILNAGFLTVFLLRLAQRQFRKERRLVSRLVHRCNMVLSASELSPVAEIGSGLFLPHPYGVTIGAGCVVEQDVTLFQGVVLGARTPGPGDPDTSARYPTIGRSTVIYPHALVYGGIRVGLEAVVLGNSVVNRDVPDGETVAGTPARVLRSSPA